jgi:hypothetical protein
VKEGKGILGSSRSVLCFNGEKWGEFLVKLLPPLCRPPDRFDRGDCHHIGELSMAMLPSVLKAPSILKTQAKVSRLQPNQCRARSAAA